MQQEKKDGPINPIGLYKHLESGRYIGATSEVIADAVAHQGYKLVKEGNEAALMSEADYASLDKPLSASPKKEAK